MPDTQDYLSLFLNDVPMMDVRAPVEFDKGSFPQSQNVPILDDQQREAIGKRYKDAGQDEAIELGLELATPEIRSERITLWKKFVEEHPEGYLYCFRGGLRSRTTQAWLREQGIDYPLVQGGYKAMRQYLLNELATSRQQIPLIILSGLTGSGKTHVLKQVRFHVDLEGLANHRGSAFGRDVDDFQPTQINWENAFSIALLKHRHQHPGCGLLLEDEGRLIGRIIIPDEYYRAMEQSPRIFLQREMEQRVSIIRHDYIEANWPRYQALHEADARQQFSTFVLDNLGRIKNRLGNDRYQVIQTIFSHALQQLFEDNDSQYFNEGIELLLKEYYDPMYQYQLQKKPVDVIFSGDEADILEWAEVNLAEVKK